MQGKLPRFGQSTVLQGIIGIPQKEAAELHNDRYPLPRFIDTEEGGSQARFLYSKLNPSVTNTNDFIGGGGAGGGAIVLTDVSLQVFMSHLQKLVVSGSS